MAQDKRRRCRKKDKNATEGNSIKKIASLHGPPDSSSNSFVGIQQDDKCNGPTSQRIC
jgi:hypothetical protein